MGKRGSVVAVTLFAAQAAFACPQCVAAEGGGYGKYLLLASMILLPFGIAGAAIHFIRRADVHSDIE
jgi:hypothetical protein